MSDIAMLVAEEYERRTKNLKKLCWLVVGHSRCGTIRCADKSGRYFLAEIEGPEQKSDSETKKDCRCCWILTSLHSKWIFWSYRSPIGALSTALESRHPGLSSNI
ncbi:uncharacterized protein DS421_10g296770 [Arachis hypogaea]|nr:uncharacterized protein DS421_10g296770 [Arachis hypogaea]